jgi:large subunit ribosomal protein L7Ae
MAEVSKEIQNKAYEAIELARKTGKIKKGVNESTKAIEKNFAKLVVVASNVSPKEIIMHIMPLCEEKDVPYVEVGNKEELGAAAGLNVATSAVTIVKEGESKDLISEIQTNLKNG